MTKQKYKAKKTLIEEYNIMSIEKMITKSYGQCPIDTLRKISFSSIKDLVNQDCLCVSNLDLLEKKNA